MQQHAVAWSCMNYHVDKFMILHEAPCITMDVHEAPWYITALHGTPFMKRRGSARSTTREMPTHEKSHGNPRDNLMMTHEIFHERICFDVSWLPHEVSWGIMMLHGVPWVRIWKKMHQENQK